jgi:hypothetical protein
VLLMGGLAKDQPHLLVPRCGCVGCRCWCGTRSAAAAEHGTGGGEEQRVPLRADYLQRLSKRVATNAASSRTVSAAARTTSTDSSLSSSSLPPMWAHASTHSRTLRVRGRFGHRRLSGCRFVGCSERNKSWMWAVQTITCAQLPILVITPQHQHSVHGSRVQCIDTFAHLVESTTSTAANAAASTAATRAAARTSATSTPAATVCLQIWAEGWTSVFASATHAVATPCPDH